MGRELASCFLLVQLLAYAGFMYLLTNGPSGLSRALGSHQESPIASVRTFACSRPWWKAR